MTSHESTPGAASATPRKPASEQFAPVAADYARFSYHAAGPDLAPMLAAGEMAGDERVLDIGSGPGHTALLFAPVAKEVVATDPTEAMLDQGRRLARERGLENIRFECTGAESLPFAADIFDRVTSRQSAHHYEDIASAMREVSRVLRPGGRFVLIDTVAPEDEAFDCFLNEVELLRDASHVRDYRVSEWAQMFAAVGFGLEHVADWGIPLDFDDWVTRSRTPKAHVEALRRRFCEAPAAVRECFAIDDACNWSVPIALVVGTWA